MPEDLDKSGPFGIAVLHSTTSHARNASQTQSLIPSVILICVFIKSCTFCFLRLLFLLHICPVVWVAWSTLDYAHLSIGCASIYSVTWATVANIPLSVKIITESDLVTSILFVATKQTLCLPIKHRRGWAEHCLFDDDVSNSRKPSSVLYTSATQRHCKVKI